MERFDKDRKGMQNGKESEKALWYKRTLVLGWDYEET